MCGFYIFSALLLLTADDGLSLHLSGTWHSSNFFLFLAKFGFQKTDLNNKVNTQGYIYGNITLNSASEKNIPADLTLVVVDSEYFIEFFSNSTATPRTKACASMFKKIDLIAWDVYCKPNNPEDFLRRIPCPKGELCIDEDSPSRVVGGYQFTYSVQDTNQPRFWYISIVSCYRNTSCNWTTDVKNHVSINYDIWLVNGNPYTKHFNPFEHQFSFDHHNIVEIYAVFGIVYTVLVPVQYYALKKLKHALTRLLTISVVMEYAGILLNFIHYFVFAFNGVGFEVGKILGNFIDTCAQCLLTMLLLLIAKGWMITKIEFERKKLFFCLWGLFLALNIAFFIWNMIEVDIISTTGKWETWPGLCILVARFTVIVWFLHELRTSFSCEVNKDKIDFYLHFGAGFLVWFIYLPIIAIIGMKISPLWRIKTVLSVTYAADFLAFLVLVHIFWPSRTTSYFKFNMNGTTVPKTTVQLTDLGPNRFKQLLAEESSESGESEIDFQLTSAAVKPS
ncbi:integral membrane protein GPR180-like [Tubulanus polymorphus]|uniref:integral membrane protein GPR180-like n=1 Tax=Tubulanus polymorphus TaxID=672921 RepID=UPI003DA255DA